MQATSLFHNGIVQKQSGLHNVREASVEYDLLIQHYCISRDFHDHVIRIAIWKFRLLVSLVVGLFCGFCSPIFKVEHHTSGSTGYS